MTSLVRLLALGAAVTAASPAQALTATIKREVPLFFPGVYQKGTPIQLPAGSYDTIAYDGLQVWVGDRSGNVIRRFDAVSNKQKGAAIPCQDVRKLVFDGTYMWAFTLAGQVYKYNAAGSLERYFPITLTSGGVDGAAFDGDYIWASSYGDQLARIDVATRQVTYFPVGVSGSSVAFDGTNVWLTSPSYSLTKVSGTTGQVLFQTADYGGANGTNGIAFDGQYVWVLSDMSGDTVTKIDPATNQLVAQVIAYPGVHTLAFDGSLLWVVCTGSDTIVKIDVRTNQIVGTIALSTTQDAYDIAFDGTHMWVTAHSGKVFKFLAKY